MVRHIVMWKVRASSPDERRQQTEQMKAALVGMRGKIPGMTELQVGVGSASGEQQADIVLSTLHESWEALADYQKHPVHQPVKEVIGSYSVERRVIDFET